MEKRASSIESSRDELAVVLSGRNKLALLSELDLEVNKFMSTRYQNHDTQEA